MPDRPADAAAPTTVLLLPGAGLMEIQQLAVGMILVRCPGCGASQVFTTGSAGTAPQVTFLHEDDACPVLMRIEAALAKLLAARATGCTDGN